MNGTNFCNVREFSNSSVKIRVISGKFFCLEFNPARNGRAKIAYFAKDTQSTRGAIDFFFVLFYPNSGRLKKLTSQIIKITEKTFQKIPV